MAKQRTTGVVPTSSLDAEYPGDASWRRKLDDGGMERERISVEREGEVDDFFNESDVSTPTNAHAPGIPQAGTLDERIGRLEKRLKKNLPNLVRTNLEAELETLKQARRSGGTPRKQAHDVGAKAAGGGARRKPGTGNAPGDTIAARDDSPPKKHYQNKEAPRNLHPKTITRMADWQQELEKRIAEQEQLNKANLKDDSNHQPNHDPFQAIHQALQGLVDNSVVQDLVGNVTKALGIGEQAAVSQEATHAQDAPILPAQTFSRRL